MGSGNLKIIASAGLLIGGAMGIAGTFAPTEALRGLAWGVDGVSLVIAGAILTLLHFRAGHDLPAAGFLVFTAGQTLVLSGAPMKSLADMVPSFGAGVGLWAAGLALVSLAGVFPILVRLLGLAAALMFAVVAAQICLGATILPTDQPLPFFAYPVFVATMVGWAWTLLRGEQNATAD